MKRVHEFVKLLGLVSLAVFAVILVTGTLSTTADFRQNMALLIATSAGCVGFFLFSLGLIWWETGRQDQEAEPEKDQEVFETITNFIFMALGTYLASLLIGSPLLVVSVLVAQDITQLGIFTGAAALGLATFWGFISLMVMLLVALMLVFPTEEVKKLLEK